MIHSACRRLGIDPSEAAFIGDIGSDVEAAGRPVPRGVLVPTPLTRAEEVAAAAEVAAGSRAGRRHAAGGMPLT